MSDCAAIDAILPQVRSLLQAGDKVGAKDAAALLRQAALFLGRAGPDEADAERRASEMAHLAARILRASDDRALSKAVIAQLLDLGAWGEILAAAHLFRRDAASDAAQALLSSLPGSRRLLLLNRFFLTVRDADPSFLLWAFKEVHAVQNDDPEEALLFLETLAGRDEPAAWPVQNELLRSRFGIWLAELLRLPLDQEQVRFLAATVGRLRSDSLRLQLIRHLRRADRSALLLLLRCLAGSGGKGNPKLARAVSVHLSHADREVRLAAARTLVEMGAPDAGRALAFLWLKAAELRPDLPGLVLDLPEPGCAAFLDALPPEQRTGALWSLASALAVLDPRDLAAEVEGDSPEAGRIRDFVLGHGQGVVLPAFTPGPGAVRPEAPPPESRSLLDRVKDRLSRSREPDAPEAVRRLLALAPGQKVKGGSLGDVAVPDLELENVAFEGTALSGLDLRFARLRTVRFLKCRLRGVDLTGAEMAGVVFEDCELTDCRLDDARLAGLRLRNGVLRGVSLAASRIKGLDSEGCLFKGCDLWGLAVEGWAARACRFEDTEFSHAALARADWAGLELQDCRFRKTLLRDCSLRCSRTVACCFDQCRVAGLDSDDPEFLAEEDRFLARRMQDPGGRKATPPAPESDEACAPLLRRALDRWLFRRDARRRMGALLAHNRRRMAWAEDKLGRPAAEFLRLLPALLEAPFEPEGKGFAPAPACAVQGYEPDYTTRSLLARRLPADQGGAERGGSPLPVAGLYAVGCLGSIVQVRGSELEIWICHEGGEAADRIRDKLAALEAWAGAAFDLEARLLPVDLARMRRNEWGEGGQACCGASQAGLIKEEFFRTAVLLAGLRPAWWALPQGLGDREHAAALSSLRKARRPLGGELADLGRLEATDDGALLEAGLQRIPESLKNPLEVVLHLVLLDGNLAQGGTPALLCGRIRDRVCAGGRDLWETDPWAVLFAEAYERCKAAGDARTQGLLLRAFLRKTGFSGEARTSGRLQEMTGASYLEFHFPHSECVLAAELAASQASRTPGEETGSFAALAELAGRIGEFIASSWESLRSRAGALAGEELSGAADRLSSALGPREHKILRMPLVAPPGELFSGLDFACEGPAGAPLVWIARGEPVVRKDRRQPAEEIRRGEHPVPLLVWLVVNRVFRPRMPVQGAGLQAPVSAADMQELLLELHGFFPPGRVFEADSSQFLQPERVVRAFIVANFLVPREERRLREAALVCSTSRGEVFCLPRCSALERLASSPADFLRCNAPMETDPAVEIAVHLPRRALCPRPGQPVQADDDT